MTFIAGLFSGLDQQKTDNARDIALALLAARPESRGADDVNAWAHGPVALAAHARRTLDLSYDGVQPAHAADRTRAVAFDGYIANAPLLRRELEEAGRRLQGHGDAELVAEGAAHWGLNRLLQKMEGAFAFALWDADQQALHLVRDRMGARPLYVAAHPGGFAFASDYRAFGVLPGFTAILNPDAVASYLAWGYVTPPLALWQNVLALPAAHRLMLRAGDDALPAPENYWSAARALEEIALRGPRNADLPRHDRLGGQLAAEAVRIDIPFAFLDDASPAARQMRMTLARASEKQFATHAVFMPDAAALQTAFDTLAALPEPVSDPAAPAWFTAMRRAAADVGVCIAANPLATPAADDERTARLRRMAMRVPVWARVLLPASMRALVQSHAQAYAAASRLWPNIGPALESAEPRMEASTAEMLAFHAFANRFSHGVMPALDRIAAAAQVEIRLPMADARLLEYGLPAAPEANPGDAAAWMRGPLRPRIQDLMTPPLFQRVGLGDGKPYRDAWQAFLNGEDADAKRLWTLATLLAWAARN